MSGESGCTAALFRSRALCSQLFQWDSHCSLRETVKCFCSEEKNIFLCTHQETYSWSIMSQLQFLFFQTTFGACISLNTTCFLPDYYNRSEEFKVSATHTAATFMYISSHKPELSFITGQKQTSSQRDARGHSVGNSLKLKHWSKYGVCASSASLTWCFNNCLKDVCGLNTTLTCPVHTLQTQQVLPLYSSYNRTIFIMGAKIKMLCLIIRNLS